MSDYRIAVIVGSLRRESINRRLAHALTRLAPADLTFHAPRIDNLPFYNQDDDASPSDVVTAFRADIAGSQGLLFVTPEYNRSLPGVLKNALDMASRPYGKGVWAGKPAGIVSASVGAGGGAMAQQHLRNVLAFLDAPTLAQPEAFIQIRDGFFTEAGDIANADTRQFLENWMSRYSAWVRKHAP